MKTRQLTQKRLQPSAHKYSVVRSLVLSVVSFGSSSAFMGCAGPTTPIGAVWSLKPQVQQLLFGSDAQASTAKISFSPKRQVLHASKNVLVRIEDQEPIPQESGIEIRYNGLDVTHSFLLRAKMQRTPDGRKLMIRVPEVKLPSRSEHFIEVAYSTNSGRAYARYEPPRCTLNDIKTVLSTDTFTPTPQLLKLIDKIARESKVSPAFAAALVAQESGFNPQAVSRARAIGLTQMTPIAESEMEDIVEKWPRYPGINEMPLPQVFDLISLGKINSQNEWRLEPSKSVRGGLAYTQYLWDRWSTPENIARIKTYFKDPEVARTQLVLASYNSGYTRVSQSLNRLGESWLSAEELKGVRNYINRIFSFCDHFSESEVAYERET